ncbi:MAG: hypothetical protein B7X78_02070, partial [Sphingomonadales bacterium 39-62-4]
VEIGRDPENNWYLVLEWIDENLEDVIAREGAMPWPMFWDADSGVKPVGYSSLIPATIPINSRPRWRGCGA